MTSKATQTGAGEQRDAGRTAIKPPREIAVMNHELDLARVRRILRSPRRRPGRYVKRLKRQLGAWS